MNRELAHNCHRKIADSATPFDNLTMYKIVTMHVVWYTVIYTDDQPSFVHAPYTQPTGIRYIATFINCADFHQAWQDSSDQIHSSDLLVHLLWQTPIFTLEQPTESIHWNACVTCVKYRNVKCIKHTPNVTSIHFMHVVPQQCLYIYVPKVGISDFCILSPSRWNLALNQAVFVAGTL